jgi:hypothetical protein
VSGKVAVDPKTVQGCLDKAGPGDVIVLRPGRYIEGLRLIGRRGNPVCPITIRALPGAVIDGGVSFTIFNHRAQLVAKADWLLGHRPPGIQSIALEAMLTIDSCEHVRVEGLAFRAAWPTAVLVDTSSNVTLTGLRIRDSAFAFLLHGEPTRGIVIERCTWLQDTTRGDLWRRTAWDGAAVCPGRHVPRRRLALYENSTLISSTFRSSKAPGSDRPSIVIGRRRRPRPSAGPRRTTRPTVSGASGGPLPPDSRGEYSQCWQV